MRVFTPVNNGLLASRRYCVARGMEFRQQAGIATESAQGTVRLHAADGDQSEIVLSR